MVEPQDELVSDQGFAQSVVLPFVDVVVEPIVNHQVEQVYLDSL